MVSDDKSSTGKGGHGKNFSSLLGIRTWVFCFDARSRNLLTIMVRHVSKVFRCLYPKVSDLKCNYNWISWFLVYFHDDALFVYEISCISLFGYFFSFVCITHAFPVFSFGTCLICMYITAA